MIPQRCYIPSMEADETDQRSFNTTLSTQRYKFHCKECIVNYILRYPVRKLRRSIGKHNGTHGKRKFSTRKFKNRKTFLKFVRAAFLHLKQYNTPTRSPETTI